MYTYIPITSVTKLSGADKFKAAIDGKSFMNFEVIVAPCGGGFQVGVQTIYDADPERIQSMLNLLMFCAIQDN